MNEIELTAVVGEMVKTLSPLTTDERRRAINALKMLLGEQSSIPSGAEDPENDGFKSGMGSSRATTWMKQNDLKAGEIEQVFHNQDGAVDFIAPDVPGSNDKDKTLSAYILAGIRRLLQNGTPDFDDGSAKELCKTLGCLNPKNHAKYIAGRGNEFTGSKEKGWTLTAPGLKRGAALIKELVSKK